MPNKVFIVTGVSGSGKTTVAKIFEEIGIPIYISDLEAKKIMEGLETEPVNNDKLYAIATIKNFLGDKDEAFKIFQKLASDKYGIMIYMRVEKNLFSDDPRYDGLLKSIGL